MAKATAMSLPDEVMIEILSRVDSTNHLELRCVCKLWKLLVLDPLFMKNHLLTSITDLASICCKANEQFNALKSCIKEEEKEHNEEDLDVDINGEEDEDGDGANFDAEEEEEEDVDFDAEQEEEESKNNVLAELNKFMEKDNQLEKKVENLDNLDVQWMIINVAKFDNILTYIGYIKSFTLNFLESIKSLEDRMELKGNLESVKGSEKVCDKQQKEEAELMRKES
ncbi:F-box-like protein [Medicago truncatula]|uniref:F-box-like protein n=1 Tax=Medicago truncatula TaxID=3880 RepID=A0A072VHM1_MEDTR|nr:F-box-like protein [Medicago truncatula]